MKFTYNWLKDFVEIKIKPQALAERLTMAGLEVTSLEEKSQDAVFEIEVTSNRPDWLSIVGIAREVAAITNSKLKTPACPADRPACPAGRQSSKLPAESGTPDYPFRTGAKTKNHTRESLKIEIQDKKDCPLYTAKIIRDLRVGASAAWLKERLELIGCRSINNVVDITNYILFTWGEPLHAFDLDKLASGIVTVRRARSGERITAIDGVERQLGPENLIIADKEKPVAIAGIMGAKASEVTEGTKNILLEAAIFNPVLTRRSRQKLGMQTDSSYRFERGIDSETVQQASLQAQKLIQELAAGELVLEKKAGLSGIAKKTVSLDKATVDRILGVNLASSKIKDILSRLGFVVKSRQKNKFLVTVPLHRQDVGFEVDLIEEIARVFGYAAIPNTVAYVRPNPAINETRDKVSQIKNILVSLGLQEVITYSMENKEALSGFQEGAITPIEILNPLSSDQEVLRPLLSPGLAACVAYNLQQKHPYVNIFEVAKTYVDADKERFTLGIAQGGQETIWFGPTQGHINLGAGFLPLKGILERLLQRLGIQEKEYRFVLDKGGYLAELWVNQERIGILRRLNKQVLDRLQIKHREVFLAEINLEGLLSKASFIRPYRPFSRYPEIIRDTTLELRDEVSLEQIMKAIAEQKVNLLEETTFAAYFEGEKVPASHKRITLTFRYCSPERTLTEEEVNSAHANIVRILQDRFGATIC